MLSHYLRRWFVQFGVNNTRKQSLSPSRPPLWVKVTSWRLLSAPYVGAPDEETDDHWRKPKSKTIREIIYLSQQFTCGNNSNSRIIQIWKMYSRKQFNWRKKTNETLKRSRKHRSTSKIRKPSKIRKCSKIRKPSNLIRT